MVDHNNKEGVTYKQGINRFTDMEIEEFKREYLMSNA